MTTVELDVIRVKGKREPQRIFSLLGTADVLQDPEVRQIVTTMHDVQTAYRGQYWDELTRLLDSLAGKHLALLKLEVYEQLYRARVEAFRREPPPPGWDGVYTAETK